jgi:uncharacterized protein (DUF1501 family)
MTHHHHAAPAAALTRREWLARSGLGLAGALGAGTLGNLMLATRPAYAADYKALVCIFLYGGNDGLNTIVPTDAARHNQYKAVRAGLHLPVASLRPLTGTSYGLHPALAGLAPVWADGKLAPVFNVGTLYKPMTKAQFRAEPASSDLIPDNLFSHSDQQNLWENGTTDTMTRTGWGGRASVALGTANPVISVGGTPRFGLSDTQSPLVLPETPGDTFGAYNLQPADLTYAPNAARKKALDALYAEGQSLELREAFTAAQRNAFSVSDRLGALVKVKPGSAGTIAAIDTAFASLTRADKTLATPIARQLYQIAKLVAGNATVLGNRQIFFAQMGGFDTHGGQLVSGSPTEGTHADLLQGLGDALGAFYAAMKALGLSDAVTAFTQSDFGRTFKPNNSTGTDHAWGNQHIVLGGAVKGGTTYGTYPDLTLGGADDVGVESWELQGRWIPTTSVDQYAATLLGWFGASDAQLATVLPNLRNYTTKKLGFV